jgi:hypothetical protein
MCCSTHKNANLNFVVFEFNVPRTNSSIKQLRGKLQNATEPDQVNFILERLRYDQTGRCLSFAIPKRVIGEKMFALRLRTSAT